MTAARCVLSKSGKIENIDDDVDVLGDKSGWWEGEFDDEKGVGEDDTNKENGNIDNGRTDVGKIAETIVIGRLGNKPPINAYVKKKKNQRD